MSARTLAHGSGSQGAAYLTYRRVCTRAACKQSCRSCRGEGDLVTLCISHPSAAGTARRHVAQDQSLWRQLCTAKFIAPSTDVHDWRAMYKCAATAGWVQHA